jgi:RNA polymerase sigma-70 factor (ECF subfamily)
MPPSVSCRKCGIPIFSSNFSLPNYPKRPMPALYWQEERKGMPVPPRYQVIEDGDLVAASLAGSRDAYDELARRYRGAVILVAWKVLGSREAAQDAAQEAFLAAFQQLRQLKEPARFGSWLCAIAGNCARRVRHRESRSQPVESEQMDRLLTVHGGDQIANPVETLLKNERDTAIQRLVAGLPAGVQIVVQLYYSEQWEVARIAEFLSLTKTTVKWRLHSGRKQIARELLSILSDENQTQMSGAAVKTDKGNNNHGQDQEERNQAYSPHPGRDCLAGRRG